MAAIKFTLGGLINVNISSKGTRIGGKLGDLYISKRVIKPLKKGKV